MQWKNRGRVREKKQGEKMRKEKEIRNIKTGYKYNECDIMENRERVREKTQISSDEER